MMRKCKIFIGIFLLTIFISCSQNKKHPTSLKISLITNHAFFENHSLTIKSVELINHHDQPVSITNKAEVIDFANSEHTINWFISDSQLTTLKGARITLGLENINFSMPLINEEGELTTNTFTIEDTTGANIPLENSEIIVSIEQDIKLKKYTLNSLFLFYDTAQSVGIDSKTNTVIYSPVFYLLNSPSPPWDEANIDNISEITQEETDTPKEFSLFQSGRIHKMSEDTLVIKYPDTVQEINLSTVDIAAASPYTHVLSKKHLHVGQEVTHDTEQGKLILSPSVLIVEVPLLPTDATQYAFYILSINNLPFFPLFKKEYLTIDYKKFSEKKQFNPPEKALLKIEGYIDSETDTLILLGAEYIAHEEMEFSINFPNSTPIRLTHNRSENYTLVGFEGDFVSETTAVTMIKDVNIPLKRQIRGIKCLVDGHYSIKLQMPDKSFIKNINENSLIQQLEENFSDGWMISAINITGSYDISSQTILANKTLFTLAPTDSTDSNYTFDSSFAEVAPISTNKDNVIAVVVSTTMAGIATVFGAGALAWMAYKSQLTFDSIKSTFDDYIKPSFNELSTTLKDVSEASQSITTASKSIAIAGTTGTNALIKIQRDGIETEATRFLPALSIIKADSRLNHKTDEMLNRDLQLIEKGAAVDSSNNLNRINATRLRRRNSLP